MIREGVVDLLGEVDHHILRHNFYGVCMLIGNLMERWNIGRVVAEKCPACGENLLCRPVNKDGSLAETAKCLWCEHVEENVRK